MAYGNPGNPGPGSDEMYTDGPMEKPGGEKEESYDGATGILPKSLMAGKDFKVGEEIMLEITRIGEKDFEVKYASEKGEGEHEEPHDESGYGSEDTTPTNRGDRGIAMGSMMY